MLVSGYSSHRNILQVSSCSQCCVSDVGVFAGSGKCIYEIWSYKSDKFWVGCIERNVVDRWKVLQQQFKKQFPGHRLIRSLNVSEWIFSGLCHVRTDVHKQNLLKIKQSIIRWSKAKFNHPFVDSFKLAKNCNCVINGKCSKHRCRKHGVWNPHSRRRFVPLVQMVFRVVDSSNDFQTVSLEVLASRFCDFRQTKWKVCAKSRLFLKRCLACVVKLRRLLQRFSFQQQKFALARMWSVDPSSMVRRKFLLRLPYVVGVNAKHIFRVWYASQISNVLIKGEFIRVRIVEARTSFVVDMLHDVCDFCKKVDISEFDCVCDVVTNWRGIEDLGFCCHTCVPCCNAFVSRNVLPFDLNCKTSCVQSSSCLIHV